MINTAVGKDTHVIENKPDPEVETEAARRLAEALDPSVIDALLADAKTAGTPVDGVDGLLNQMGVALLEGSRGVWDDSVEVAGFVDASAFLFEVVAPVGIEVSVAA